MLTVIVYRKSSQEFIDRYRSLFEPYLDTGKIAFCFWDEHGTDIATALPELAGIVRGVRQWKAIVALPIAEEDIPAEETRRDNPFDYLCNSAPEPAVHESQVPLIRLAQMLGGVPLVNQHYVSVMEQIPVARNEGETEEAYHERKGKLASRRLSIRRQETENQLQEQQAIWDALDNKYSFPCERPSVLYLFKAKAPQAVYAPTVTDQEAMKRRESDSSLFWYRNRYPARARFLTQDCAIAGNANYQRDLFQFWMTVFTLAINTMPTGTFEAYKLYQVVGRVEENRLHKLFSDYYNRLSGAQFSASRQIIELQKTFQFTRELDELPAYREEIPVQFELTEKDALYISSGAIGLAGDCPIQEEPWWHKMVRASMQSAKKLIHSTRMVLDHSSTMCRFAAKVTEDEIHEMDEYQLNEMDEQLDELEKQILTFNTYSFLPLKKYQRDLRRQEASAATSMKKRMTRRVTIAAGVVSLGVYLVGFLPDFVYQVRQGGHVLPILGLAGIGTLLMAAVAMCCLFHFRNVIRAKIGDYDGIVKGIVADLQNAAASFSQYLTDCCSYMRGRHIIQALKNRTELSTIGIFMLNRHVEQLGQQMEIINSWLSDFDLKALPDVGSFKQTEFDFDIPPEKNRGYLIQTENMEVDIPSVGGSICKAPYPFVTELSVRREPLYEKQRENEEA